MPLVWPPCLGNIYPTNMNLQRLGAWDWGSPGRMDCPSVLRTRFFLRSSASRASHMSHLQSDGTSFLDSVDGIETSPFLLELQDGWGSDSHHWSSCVFPWPKKGPINQCTIEIANTAVQCNIERAAIRSMKGIYRAYPDTCLFCLDISAYLHSTEFLIQDAGFPCRMTAEWPRGKVQKLVAAQPQIILPCWSILVCLCLSLNIKYSHIYIYI